MLIRIILTGTCIFAAMDGVEEEERSVLVRACTRQSDAERSAVVQHGVEGSELAACRAGKLEGRPDLHRRGCLDAGTVGVYQYWRCPAGEATH